MFCLEIRKLAFGWRPYYFRLQPPCFIHYPTVRGANLKSSRPDVFHPSDVLIRSLTLRRMFSTSPSTVSFCPDDWAPSVSTTLAHRTLALKASIRSGAAAWSGCKRGSLRPSMRASVQTCMWVNQAREPLLASPLIVHSSPSPSYCCSCGAEPPAVTRPGGQPASCAEKKEKQKESRVKINSSLN